jgi:hypothetical protein
MGGTLHDEENNGFHFNCGFIIRFLRFGIG